MTSGLVVQFLLININCFSFLCHYEISLFIVPFIEWYNKIYIIIDGWEISFNYFILFSSVNSQSRKQS
jgi:hypothetical protein